MATEGRVNGLQDPHLEQERLVAVRNQWSLLFQDSQSLINAHVPDDEKLLFERSQVLAKAWERFRASLPKEQQQMYQDQPPSLKALYEAVNTASQTWTEKRNGTLVGRLRRTFARLCISLDNHSHVLEMVPRNDKYVCLLTGALTTIVQATVNHVKIAEAISQSLERMIVDIAFWSEQMELYKDNAKMLEIMRELYVVIFEFLTNVFNKWSTSGFDRFLKSFDKNFFDRQFEANRARIDELSMRLERQARLLDQKKIREMDMMMCEKFNALEKGLRSQSERDYRGSIASTGSNSSLNYSRLASQGASMDSSRTSSDSSASNITFVYYKLDIIEALTSSGSSPIVGSASLMKEELLPTYLAIDPAVLDRLQAWMRSSGPDNLWIQGPSLIPHPSQNSKMARALVAAARSSDIPVIQCFVLDADTKATPSCTKSLPKYFENFLQGLLVQLAMLVPNSFTSDRDLSKTRLTKFMRSETESSSESRLDYLFDILITLRTLLPPSTLCVIDGLQALEDRSDKDCTAYLYKLLDILYYRGQDGSGSGAMVKLCFTTDGYVDALAMGVENRNLDKIAYDHEADEPTIESAVEVDHSVFV